ncbi:hypothetical protein UA08_04565 [Talaromyces atroroseus]|uniref:Uncharacterized protein n=1 Tax=Talaromyces atroroseus TaxID=1441469 RepID=A0A225AFE8_TALAT|nr:hypothetical protein UA08_04565 [Talaromyces atroroseus]OKL60041.1 hypothetical protein UA08_04565 [Talaromyces atroroseus]
MDGSVDASSVPSNSSFGQDDDPVKLFLCWSSTCVPNPSTKYPLLAPIDHPDICPLGSKERWELRARGLGCNVSTRNFLSVIVAVASSLALIGLIALIFASLKKMIRWCTTKKLQRAGRGRLGIIFFRDWDDDRAHSSTGRRRGRRTAHGAPLLNETSPLLRRDDQELDV